MMVSEERTIKQNLFRSATIDFLSKGGGNVTVKSTEKTLLAAAVAAALGLAAAPAQALEGSFSGHLNRAWMAADDGEDSESFFVDGEPSNTRVRVTGTQEVSPGLEAGLYMEWELVSNNSSDVSIDAAGGGTDPGFEENERHFDAFIQGDWGKLSLGQGNGAANGATESDLSGTFIAGYAGIADIGGNIAFRNEDTLAFGPRITDVSDQFDFLSRYDRVRYDFPSAGPVSVAIATGTVGGDDATDAAVRLNTDFDGGKFAGALGFSSLATGGVDGSVETTGGSGSVLFDNGFNVTLSFANREDDDQLDASNFYTKVGYRSGQHAVSADFGVTEDLAAEGDEGETTGVQYVYKPIDWMELYAAGKVHSLDRDAQDFDDISIFIAGTRIKF